MNNTEKSKESKTNNLKKGFWRVRIHLSKHYLKYFLVLFVVLLISIPFVLYGLARCNPFIASVVNGDVLAFYGVAFGIFSSFFLWFLKNKVDEEHRLRKNRPRIVLQAKTVCEEKRCFTIRLINIGMSTLTQIHLDGEFLKESLEPKDSLTLKLVCEDVEDRHPLDKNSYCICRVGRQRGIPDVLTVQCNDSDDMQWCIEYKCYKTSNGFYCQQTEMYMY